MPLDFEKEADEYIKKIPFVHGPELVRKIVRKFCKDTFKNGAEFGYNKANEWHFDEAPDNENDILCQIAKDESVVGYYSESKKRYYTIDGQSIEVIAWKEIVLPELKEIK